MPGMMKPALIFSGGEFKGLSRLEPFNRNNYRVYCADRGAEDCLKCGIVPDALVGDFDSITPATLEVFRAKGVGIHRFPCEKDKTDLELTLDLAEQEGATEFLIFGAAGRRLDHFAGNIMLCASERYLKTRMTLIDGQSIASRLAAGQQVGLNGRVGEKVSLIPLSQTVAGVATRGLKWALSGATLKIGSSLSLRNELKGEDASVRIESGVLLVVHTAEEP